MGKEEAAAEAAAGGGRGATAKASGAVSSQERKVIGEPSEGWVEMERDNDQWAKGSGGAPGCLGRSS